MIQVQERAAHSIRWSRCLVATGLVVLLASRPTCAAVGDPLFKLTASDAAAGDQFGYSVGASGNIAIVGAIGDADQGEDTGSAYLLDVTTGDELFKLTASDAAEEDQFGWSVDTSDTTAIVGARFDNGVDTDSGSAYLFDVATGNELFKLTASDAAAEDWFGSSVGISGATAIVGAVHNGDAGLNSGSAYLFDVTTGNELFKLTASDAAAGDEFGISVDISGQFAIVGAVGDAEQGSNTGAAYVFDATTGDELFKLTASDAAAGDNFGISVGISGNLAIVAAPHDDDHGISSGSAYMFDVTTGEELFKLTASDAVASDQFGFSVDIDGDVAIVGARNDDDDGISSGSAYMFDVITGDELAKLTASDAAAFDQFGWSVGIGGRAAIVGAVGNSDAGSLSGSAYLHSAVPEPPTVGLLLVGLPLLARGDRWKRCRGFSPVD